MSLSDIISFEVRADCGALLGHGVQLLRLLLFEFCTHAVIWARDDHTGTCRQHDSTEREPRCNHQPSSERFTSIQALLQNHEA